MKQIRIAILGQGRSGRDIHGLHLKKDTERFKVVAVVDQMDIRRERAAKEYGCEGNLVAGANIAGFIKVADAMKWQGIAY